MSYKRNNFKAEPERFYYDGLKLWGIYEIKTNRPTYKRKRAKKYLKGSHEYYGLIDTCIFKNYHSTISLEQAENLYPEYFI